MRGVGCGVRVSREVTLRAPPPLDHPMTLRTLEDGSVVLEDDGQPLAAARKAELALEVPSLPTTEKVDEATTHYTGLEDHALPECFVCGTAREAPDGLRIFPGKLADDAPAVAPWTPDESVCDEDGRVREQVVWAALDCPGYFGIAGTGEFALLGRMTGRVDHRPRAGERCTAMGWAIERDGRKLHAGSALFDSEGRLCGLSRQVWITPK